MNPKEKQSHPRISVALATFNGERFLREQLDSLAQQTLLPYELVITDDGSEDRTLEIIEEFSRTAPFQVRPFRNEQRLGYRDNFLKAARLCTGDLIAFCDQDDVWITNKLERVAQEFEDPDVLLVIHDAKIVTSIGDDGLYFQASDCNIPFAVQFGNSMIFRACTPLLIDIERPISERDPDDSPLAHDEWIPFLASSLGKCVNVRSPLILYRQHGNNACGFGGRTRADTADQFNRRVLRYQHRSLRAEEHANALRKVIEVTNLPRKMQIKALSSLARWQRYARLLHLRADLYQGHLHFFGRINALMRIFFLRGYTRIQLGRRALIKDTSVALTGASNYL